MKSYVSAYFDNFKGFSREIWVLTLITYINRAGAMVMPFLSKYLLYNYHFDASEIGTILACIGLGSLFGSWLSGKLTDKFGFYTIMLSSLFLTGFGIIAIMFLYDFVELCIGLFLLTAIADMYKPAMYVAVSNFTNKKNRTRALTLIRLAVNIGIVTGPVVAGLLVYKDNYDMLFWIDGITCLIAITLFMLLIDEGKIYKARKRLSRQNQDLKITQKSILFDRNYILFLFASFITAFMFFQLFTTIPLYNTEQLKLTELQIGMLLALNGLIIFLFEMPLIGYLEKKEIEMTKIIMVGAMFMTLGFFSLLLSKVVLMMIISIFLITIGQILLFSFSNTFAFSKAVPGHEGKYMALYTMSFSCAQITSPKIGMAISYGPGFAYNWILMGTVGIIGIFMYYILHKNTMVKVTTIN